MTRTTSTVPSMHTLRTTLILTASDARQTLEAVQYYRESKKRLSKRDRQTLKDAMGIANRVLAEA